MFERCELWQKQGQEGRWPDCDMLPFGVIGTGFEKARSTNFTREEQRTVMTLWSIFRSPLIMGGDLTRLDDWTRSLMTNESVLAAQQTGREPEQIMKDGNQAVWTSLAEGGGRYLALFNLSDEIRTVTADLSDLEFAAGKAEDLWGGRPATLAGSRLCVDIPPHGAAMYRLRR
jgi:hypothetical protein